jgi:hypothetical protein
MGSRRGRDHDHPTGTGQQTNRFGRTQGTSVIAPGDSVGFFYPGKGWIAVTLGSGVPVVGESGFGGLQAGATQIDTSSTVGNRTYAVSYTSDQVSLTTASAPSAGAISDLCQNCLYQYTPGHVAVQRLIVAVLGLLCPQYRCGNSGDL